MPSICVILHLFLICRQIILDILIYYVLNYHKATIWNMMHLYAYNIGY